jgi:hypothetical protein
MASAPWAAVSRKKGRKAEPDRRTGLENAVEQAIHGNSGKAKAVRMSGQRMNSAVRVNTRDSSRSASGVSTRCSATMRPGLRP